MSMAFGRGAEGVIRSGLIRQGFAARMPHGLVPRRIVGFANPDLRNPAAIQGLSAGDQTPVMRHAGFARRGFRGGALGVGGKDWAGRDRP